MIPKIIHYCWFGGSPKSKKMLHYIETWKRYFPDYNIFEWNETNFDINSCEFVKQAYIAKKYAFVSDYVRLYALYTMGGIYFDTDIEVLKDFRSYFQDKKTVLGFEDSQHAMTAFIATEAGELWIENLIKHYQAMNFVDELGNYNTTPNPIFITKELVKYGLVANGEYQTFGRGFVIYPFDYFSAYDLVLKKIVITNNTVCIHHCGGSWLTVGEKIKMKLKSFIIQCFGEKCFEKIKYFLLH